MRPLFFRDPFFTYRHRKAIHTFRALVALALTLLALHLLDLPHGSWALVSVLMVMGGLPHIGGVLEKGLQRLAGTIMGGLIGIVLLLMPMLVSAIPLAMLAVICLATYTTFNSRYSYSVAMFNITLVMVLGDGNPDISVAVWRSCNVVLGTCIAIAVTMVVQPQKATDVLRFLLASNLDRLARVYRIHSRTGDYDSTDTGELMKQASTRLIAQRGLVDAVHREGRLKRGVLNEILSLERRMISTVELLLETHWDTKDGHTLIEGMTGLREEQRKLAEALGTLAYEIRTGQLINLDITPFNLQQYAEVAMHAQTQSGRALFSPSGYLWLNRELGQQTMALVAVLGNIQRLPSQRLRKRARKGHLICD